MSARVATPLLEVEHLGTYYGGICALHDVSLAVSRGALVALVGANGAGKTTLLHTISGVLQAAEGRVVFDGQEITHLRAEKRVRLGISQVPEGRQVFGPLSVEDNLMLGAYTRTLAEARQTLEEIWSRFPDLAGRRGQKAWTLSGGEQQLLAIGRALMARPRLLLLDEPGMGLAPQLSAGIFRIIVELVRAGTTVLLVEQNANAALAVADFAYVLETGRTVISGPGAELLRDARVQAAYLGV